jgi:hypothetical protein
MCAALPPLRCPDPSHVPLPYLPRRSPASRWLPLASPRRPPSAQVPPAAGAAHLAIAAAQATAVQSCATLPSPTCRLVTSSTASAVLLSLCHVGPPALRNRHAPGGYAGAARRPEPARECSPSPSPSHRLSRAISYKTDSNPTSPRLISFSPSSRPPSPPPHSSPDSSATASPRPKSSCPSLPHLLH